MPFLTSGDLVELIAPASRCSDNELIDLKKSIESWGLTCIIQDNIFGKDLFCANTDEARFKQLKHALKNPETKAIICARGGYGSMRLIPKLQQMDKPKSPKLFVGMSDITALHLFFQQQWGWSSIHGAASPNKVSQESLASLKSILFGEVACVEFAGLNALNQQANLQHTIQSSVLGGNLTLIQSGIGTAWELDGRDKIILIEEVGERAYRIDRMLEQLLQANIIKNAAAIVFADFLDCEEPDSSSLIQPVLHRFADRCEMPVVQLQGIGHGYINFPIPLGTKASLQLGDEINLRVSPTNNS